MKRLLSVVLLFSFLIVVFTALADSVNDFTFIGNMRFGMSIREVETALKKSNIRYSYYDYSNTPNKGYASRAKSYGIENPKMFSFGDVRVAGYTADGYFLFDADDKLSDIEYIFYFETGRKEQDKVFEAIENILISRYDDTEFNYKTGKKMNLKISHEPIRLEGISSIWNFDLLNYSERRIVCDEDMDVIIQHHEYISAYTTNNVTIGDKHYTKVSYSLSPKESAVGSNSWGF